MAPATEQAWKDLAIEAGRVFTPTSPIDERSLFAGREEQVLQIIDVINQKGQHTILFGERGVGKTSLANVLSAFLGNPGASVVAPRVNCDAADTFSSVWGKIFEQIQLTRSLPPMGFNGTLRQEAQQLLTETADPDSVRRALTVLSQAALPILIIDEFDRLEDQARKVFADMVKALSDHAVNATVVLVGVADSVDGLIQDHQSVERALVQIKLPRMSTVEVNQIVETGLGRLEMKIEQEALARIGLLAQGLPHYAHLISLHASRAAIDQRSVTITTDHVGSAVKKAIQGAQHSIRSAYELAIRSPRKDNLFGDVLLACALAKPNELGQFAAQDVREPMQRITGKNYDIPSFAQHLNEFSEAKRGNILQKTGSTRRFRYRFSNPLMQPFVIMQGLNSNRIEARLL